MFLDTLIPAFAPPEQLGWLRWRVLLIFFAIVAVVALIVQLLILSRQEQEREEKERERDRQLEKLVLFFEQQERIGKQTPGEVEKAKEPYIQPDDPQIYLGIEPSKESMFRRTPFILCNRGKTAAHNVIIQPFKLDRKAVTFQTVGVVPAGDKVDILPTIEQDGHMLKHDIFHWLIKDWDGNGQLTNDWPILLTITYSDPSNRKHFSATMTLMFHPIWYIMYRNQRRRNDPPFIRKEPTWEFKDIKFTPVTPPE